MKKFATIICISILTAASAFNAIAADAADASAVKEKVKALEVQVAQLKAKITEQAKFDAEIISKVRAENRALKKQLRAAKLSQTAAATAPTSSAAKKETAAAAADKAAATKERAAAVEEKTEDRISERADKSDSGFHMFPF